MWNSISLNNYKINHNSSSNETHQGSSSSESSATGDSQPLGYKASLNECGNFTLKEVCQYIFGRIITGASYTVRHWELAKNAETHQAAFAHRLLGFLEGIPIAGSVVAVVERFLLEKPKQEDLRGFSFGGEINYFEDLRGSSCGSEINYCVGNFNRSDGWREIEEEIVERIPIPFNPDIKLSNLIISKEENNIIDTGDITFKSFLEDFGFGSIKNRDILPGDNFCIIRSKGKTFFADKRNLKKYVFCLGLEPNWRNKLDPNWVLELGDTAIFELNKKLILEK